MIGDHLDALVKECQEAMVPKGEFKSRELVPFSFEVPERKVKTGQKSEATQPCLRPSKSKRRSQTDPHSCPHLPVAVKATSPVSDKKQKVKKCAKSQHAHDSRVITVVAASGHGAGTPSPFHSGGFAFAAVPAPAAVPPPLELICLRQSSHPLVKPVHHIPSRVNHALAVRVQV